MAIQLPSGRDELEAMALAVCPTESIYELRDSIDGADDASLLALIINNDTSDEALPTDDFLSAVKPAYRRLLFMQIRFRQVDISTLSLEALQNELDALEAQEKRVMLAWARSTQDINPGLLADVESGRCRYTNATEGYLNRTFLGN